MTDDEHTSPAHLEAMGFALAAMRQGVDHVNELLSLPKGALGPLHRQTLKVMSFGMRYAVPVDLLAGR